MIAVAGYCRVSTDREDQANSFASQQQFFRDCIARNPQWELYEIYADEGLSGTSTRKRQAFNRMISDAYTGKFQLILTKEVSRFSRNIVDTLVYTRELKNLGVAVSFVNDNINTMDCDGELRLSIMATIAQEESRKTSNRVVWGQTRQMEKGVVFGQPLLGYDLRQGVLSVEPEGAKLVRLIFRKYALEQVSTAEIARYLAREGFCPGRKWTASAILKILKNEKYVGDLVQKKTYTPDYLTHETRTNRGEVPLIRIENHHEPIVSRELWDLARQQMAKNNKHGSPGLGHSNRYVFSGRIKCGLCGASFVSRVRRRKDGTRVRRWSCATATRDGVRGCAVGRLLRDDDGMRMLKEALRQLPMDIFAIADNVTALVLEATGQGREGPKVEEEVLGILRGEGESEVFWKMLLQSLTVFEDRHMELRFFHLPMVFRFGD